MSLLNGQCKKSSSASKLLALVAPLCFFLSHVSANASISAVSTREQCKIEIYGTIQPGDAAKLQEILAPYSSGSDDSSRLVACLNSPGGSLSEALRIGEIFHKYGVGTKILGGDSCLSACAVAFMFGSVQYIRGQGGTNRNLHIDGRLAFHGPSLKLPSSDRYSEETVAQAFSVAIESVVDLVTLGNIFVNNTNTPIIESDLLREMLSHKDTDYFEIDTVEKAGRWGIDVIGWSPPPVITIENAFNACANASYWPMSKALSQWNFQDALLSTELDHNWDESAQGFRRDIFEVDSLEESDNLWMWGIKNEELRYTQFFKIGLPLPSDENFAAGCIIVYHKGWLFGVGGSHIAPINPGQNGSPDRVYFIGLPAITLASPDLHLRDLNKTLVGQPIWATCIVRSSDQEIERQRCLARSRLVENTDGTFSMEKQFSWPSGSKTLVLQTGNAVSINGNQGEYTVNWRDHMMSEFDLCVLNTVSRNEFCHIVDRRHPGDN